YAPQELTGSAVLSKLAARVAPPSVKHHLAEREAERERRERAWQDEQAARLKQQREQLATGKFVRCACCGGPIETEAEAVEKHGTLVHAGDCESPGVWIGRGARELELEGVVREGELGRLIAGQHPRTEEQLRRHYRVRQIAVERIDPFTGERSLEVQNLAPVAGFDLVFS